MAHLAALEHARLSLVHWERYYRSGALACWPGGAGGSYDLEVRESWAVFFAGLPEGARILDIGTGNGAVALIASETAQLLGRHFEIHGSDLASIDPRRDVPDGSVRMADIVFHPRVATESLPFESSSFDAVSGQYALEYAPIAAALGEIHRVLRTAGRAQFILHHENSQFVCNARESLVQAQLVLNETRVLGRLRRYLDSLRNSAGTAHHRRWRDLKDAIQTLRRAATAAGTPWVLGVTLDAIEKLLAARGEMTLASLDLEVERFERDLRASVWRLQDLVRAARSEIGIVEIEQMAAAAGFEIERRAPQVHNRVNLVGWLLILSRR